MEVLNVDVYSGRPNDPVDAGKVEALCADGWFPVSINVPADLGQVSYKVTGIFVKRGDAPKDNRLDEIEKKLDTIIRWFAGGDGSAKKEKPATGKKKGK